MHLLALVGNVCVDSVQIQHTCVNLRQPISAAVMDSIAMIMSSAPDIQGLTALLGR